MFKTAIIQTEWRNIDDGIAKYQRGIWHYKVIEKFFLFFFGPAEGSAHLIKLN